MVFDAVASDQASEMGNTLNVTEAADHDDMVRDNGFSDCYRCSCWRNNKRDFQHSMIANSKKMPILFLLKIKSWIPLHNQAKPTFAQCRRFGDAIVLATEVPKRN